MKVFCHNLQGKRESQEDQHIAVLNITGNDKSINPINFFGVFDGHGGKRVSKYLKDNLPTFFLNKFNVNVPIYENKKNAITYFNYVYNFLQNKLKKDHPKAVEYCGSTACVAINYVDNDNQYLWIINVGDSRAIFCDKNNNTIQLTIDHKPNLPEEKKRIEKLGGKIQYDGYEWRVKSLSLSRAFGDLDCTPYVSHLPNIYNYKINKNDKFMVIGCDGLYDVLKNEDIVKFILDLQSKNFNGNYAKEIATYALNKGSQDNISAIVYFF
jgi:serine/threonine protein phosphatase PrpC